MIATGSEPGAIATGLLCRLLNKMMQPGLIRERVISFGTCLVLRTAHPANVRTRSLRLPVLTRMRAEQNRYLMLYFNSYAI